VQNYQTRKLYRLSVISSNTYICGNFVSRRFPIDFRVDISVPYPGKLYRGFESSVFQFGLD